MFIIYKYALKIETSDPKNKIYIGIWLYEFSRAHNKYNTPTLPTTSPNRKCRFNAKPLMAADQRSGVTELETHQM